MNKSQNLHSLWSSEQNERRLLMFPSFFRLLCSAPGCPAPLRHVHGGETGGASLQLEAPPVRGESLQLPRPVGVSAQHRLRAGQRGQVAAGEVWRAAGGASGEAPGRELFSDHQGRSDRGHGQVRELHGGGRSQGHEDSGLRSERQALRHRWDSRFFCFLLGKYSFRWFSRLFTLLFLSDNKSWDSRHPGEDFVLELHTRLSFTVVFQGR